MKNAYLLLSIFLTNIIYAQDLNLEYAKAIEGDSYESGNSVCRDNDGNTFSTGLFQETADFDPGIDEYNLTSNGLQDIFIQKLDENGALLWAKALGGSSYDKGISVACASDGSVYIGGFYNGTVDFDPGTEEFNLSAVGFNEVFVLKLDADGNFEWVKSLVSATEQTNGPILHTLETDLNDNVYLGGSFQDTVDFDPGIDTYLLGNDGWIDAFVMKLSSDGEFEWANAISGDESEVIYSLDTDDAENVFVVGTFNGTADFDPSDETVELTSVEGNDMFIQKFESDGSYGWVKTIHGNFWDQLKSIALDDAGSIYLNGQFTGIVDFDPGAEEFIMETGIDSSLSYFFLKLNDNGDFQWANSIGEEYFIQNSILSVDGDGYIYASGSFYNTVDFDPNEGIFELTADGSSDIYFLKLDQNGTFIWAESIGGSSYEFVNDFEVYDDGDIHLIGAFQGLVDFDPSDDVTELDAGTGSEIFILRYSQDSCANLGISIVEVADVSCNDNGIAMTAAVNGSAPYSYLWNTDPVSTESTASFEEAGIYTLTVTDALNCVRDMSFLISGPTYITDFDLNATMTAPGFRPGFNDVIDLDGFNSGCEFVDGEMRFVLDELVSYDSANVEPDLIVGDTLIWEFSDFNYDAGHILSNLYVTTSELAEIGDTVCFDLIITPIENDLDPINNVKEYCYPVVNGFDPNNKQVYPQGICDENYTEMNGVLTYTIQFQNTGNAEAINVHIVDSLSPNLDINSVNIISKSHNMYTEVLAGNVLDFRFDNINLPDSTNNEVESHGHVTFEINHIADLSDQTLITNKSEIYFDFNPAIVTNTVQNTMVEILPLCSDITAVNEVHEKDGIVIYPNPNQGRISIDLGESKEVGIKVFSLSGQMIYSSNNSSAPLHQIELEGPSGIYILELSVNNEINYYKLIKE